MLGRSRRLFAILAIAGLGVPALAQTGSALKCSVRILKGDWGFTCTGTAPNPMSITEANPMPLIQPFAMNGTFSFDGKGQIRGPGWADFNGTVLQEYASTLSTDPMVVKPDCMGQVHYVISLGGASGQPAGEMDFKLVLLNENELLGMPTSPGMTVTCRVNRIRARD